LVSYVREFEGHVGQKFPPGYNEALRNGCIRINLDPVSVRKRRPFPPIFLSFDPSLSWQIVVCHMKP
jgi:hypothetical protein